VATSSSPPGKYAIAISIGNLSAPNYKFLFVKGILTISK
jgi:hypothetical protein